MVAECRRLAIRRDLGTNPIGGCDFGGIVSDRIFDRASQRNSRDDVRLVAGGAAAQRDVFHCRASWLGRRCVDVVVASLDADQLLVDGGLGIVAVVATNGEPDQWSSCF